MTTTSPATGTLPMLGGIPWGMALGESPTAVDRTPAPLWVAMTQRAHDAGAYEPLCAPTTATMAAHKSFVLKEEARAEGMALEPLVIVPAR